MRCVASRLYTHINALTTNITFCLNCVNSRLMHARNLRSRASPEIIDEHKQRRGFIFSEVLWSCSVKCSRCSRDKNGENYKNRSKIDGRKWDFVPTAREWLRKKSYHPLSTRSLKSSAVYNRKEENKRSRIIKVTIYLNIWIMTGNNFC